MHGCAEMEETSWGMKGSCAGGQFSYHITLVAIALCECCNLAEDAVVFEHGMAIENPKNHFLKVLR